MTSKLKNIQFFTALNVDAMFFHSAVNNLTDATKHKAVADAANEELNSIPWLDDYEVWDLGDEIDVSFSKEEIKYVEDLKDKAKEAFSRVLQSTATTHMFCVAALEAHINKIASSYIKAKMFDHYEKLSIEGKWLLLPQLLGKRGFEPGHQPFQDFSHLIKTRNVLVHYKGKKIPGFYADSTDLYKPLGLTVEEAHTSVEATKKMIVRLAEIMELAPPKWIQDTAAEYLNVEVIWE